MATVLVVDDSANNRALMSRILEKGAHQVIEAANGAEALGLARLRRPDVIFTDVLMPKVDGYELERALRTDEATASIPVVFHTAAYSSREVEDMVQQSSRLRVLPKPTDVGTVLDLVGSMAASQDMDETAVTGPGHEDHLSALNAKLLQTVRELEAAGRERQQLLGHLMQAQEDERAVIAGDIHDDSVQAMTAVAMRLELLGRELTDPALIERHRRLEETVRQAIGRLRRLLFQLHPPALERDGLGAAIESYLSQTLDPAVCEHVVVDELEGDLPTALRILVYRVVQEALVNVAKHAEASHVRVDLATEDDGVRIEVQDDGRGFVPEDVDSRPGHMGLLSMRQRVELTGGWWTLESRPAEGTTVRFWVPASSMVMP